MWEEGNRVGESGRVVVGIASRDGGIEMIGALEMVGALGYLAVWYMALRRLQVTRHGGMVFWKVRVWGCWKVGGCLYLTTK